MLEEDDGREKRLAARQEVFGHAVILAPDLRANCIIRDLSATGARLGVSRHVKLPPEFHVQLIKINSTRRVVLRWRQGDLIGVQFGQAETAQSSEQPENVVGVKSSWRGRKET
jgi:PilZ domain